MPELRRTVDEKDGKHPEGPAPGDGANRRDVRRIERARPAAAGQPPSDAGRIAEAEPLKRPAAPDRSVVASPDPPLSAPAAIPPEAPRRRVPVVRLTRSVDVELEKHTAAARRQSRNRITGWLYQKEEVAHESARPWYQVLCLTGVDYFSTLGYQPGIAFLAAGLLSPVATLILVIFTVIGALPVYSRVAAESPHGQGSIAMLERLLPRWRGKLFVLCLLGFAATSWIITITLSAADATAHIVENPFFPEGLQHDVGVHIGVTAVLIGFLGGVFLKGFKEAIGIAVLLTVVYLGLNLVVIVRAFMEVGAEPRLVGGWLDALRAERGNPLA